MPFFGWSKLYWEVGQISCFVRLGFTGAHGQLVGFPRICSAGFVCSLLFALGGQGGTVRSGLRVVLGTPKISSCRVDFCSYCTTGFGVVFLSK